MTLTARIRGRATDLGFDLIGVAPAGRALRADAYVQWVEAGRAGEMEYMTRDPQRRQDARHFMPEARSVVVVGLSHYTVNLPDEIKRDPSRGLIARYAWGLDYHDIVTPRLRELLAFIRAEARREIQAKVYVDTGPVLERDFAERAGLGFTGKNTCLIHPRTGSWLFLGEIILDLELDYDVPVTSIGCGSCTRCLSACPTNAFVAPYVLDSRRCISYLTIELKGSIPRELRKLMGNRIFGCDECQDVCPWPRRFARPTSEKAFYPIDFERAAPKLLDVIGLSAEQFRERFRGTPILRAKRKGLLRNAAIAIGNWGDETAVPGLVNALNDPEPLVRAHVAWALGEISTLAARNALETQAKIEPDPSVQQEIADALIR
ncbi:MAG TPA: tRNA epoxyqueuosine(34) reductase QueG [Anaerolineae bacterium]|nr:tRNA epoxyqueuosine(34) reductase QueG [Anaerolineae bacterium]